MESQVNDILSKIEENVARVVIGKREVTPVSYTHLRAHETSV